MWNSKRQSQKVPTPRITSTTTIETESGKVVNIVEYNCSRTISDKWIRDGKFEIKIKEMTMKVLNIMWKRRETREYTHIL